MDRPSCLRPTIVFCHLEVPPRLLRVQSSRLVRVQLRVDVFGRPRKPNRRRRPCFSPPHGEHPTASWIHHANTPMFQSPCVGQLCTTPKPLLPWERRALAKENLHLPKIFVFGFPPVGFKGNLSLHELFFPGVSTKWKRRAARASFSALSFTA